MEADRMINSNIARTDLDTEFSVVRNEMESGENNPHMMLWQRMTATAFDWHNHGKTTIGARTDVENVKIENLQNFYRKYRLEQMYISDDFQLLKRFLNFQHK